MMGRITGSMALAAFALFAGANALAQDTPAAASSAAPAAAAPVLGTSAGSSSASPAASAPAKNGPAVTGYAYREHGARRAVDTPPHHYARLVHHANEAIAKVSGFEMLADGGSRLFVQLSRQVDVDPIKDTEAAGAPGHARHGRAAKEAPGAPLTRLTYVLKGTELARANDGNALETIDFNTPVVRARLTPSGRDLRFVILLRADVTPAMKIVPAKDNGSMLQIDFPQGSYVTPGPGDATGAPTNEPTNGALPSQGTSGDANGSGNTNNATDPQ